MVTDEAMKVLHRFAMDNVGKLTFDLFASPFNAKCPRFASLYDGPGVSVVDAFTMGSWRTVKCAECSRTESRNVFHEECMYAWPPNIPTIQRRFIEKAKRDGFKGVIVLEQITDSIIWKAAQPFRLPAGAPARVDLTSHDISHQDKYKPKRLTAIAVDFASYRYIAAANTAPLCPRS